MVSISRRHSLPSSTGVLPILTTCVGPRTADAGLLGASQRLTVLVPLVCAALASVSAPAGPNRDDFDPTAEVEGRQHQTVLSMAGQISPRRACPRPQHQ